MANNIEPSSFKTDSLSDSLLPTVSDIFKQVSHQGEFQKCPILFKKISVHSTRSNSNLFVKGCVKGGM